MSRKKKPISPLREAFGKLKPTKQSTDEPLKRVDRELYPPEKEKLLSDSLKKKPRLKHKNL